MVKDGDEQKDYSDKNSGNGYINWMLRLRIRKPEQQNAILAYITYHTRVPNWNFYILGLTIGAAKNLTGEGVIYGLNLFQWAIISFYCQGIERNCLVYPTIYLLNIFMLSSHYFSLPITMELTMMTYKITKKMMINMPPWIIS